MPMTRVDTALGIIRQAIQQEQEGCPNNHTAWRESQQRRDIIATYWQEIQDELVQVQQAINALPALPDREQVRWAQSLVYFPSLALMEIDTTGLAEEDEIIRFVLLATDGHTIEDIWVKPEHAQLTAEVSRSSGITAKQLASKGISIAEAWPRIQTALLGRYVVSYFQEWHRAQLDKAAKRHHLEPITFIGECLRWRVAQYYHQDVSSLSFTTLCERIGYLLPDPPVQHAEHRARGQREIIKAIAVGISDVRPLRHAHQLEAPERASLDPVGDSDDSGPL